MSAVIEKWENLIFCAKSVLRKWWLNHIINSMCQGQRKVNKDLYLQNT